MTTQSAELDTRYGIPGVAHVVDGNGGLSKVLVTLPAATGEIYLHGAQVTSWAPAGQPDVLFVSRASRWEPACPIRGGIPVCFPWFANKADDPTAPAHGLVRTRPWSLDAIRSVGDAVLVEMSIEGDDETRGWWPFTTRLVLRVRFGAALHLELIATNLEKRPITIEEALHTYYAVGDAASVRISGLEGTTYLDKVDQFKERLQRGDIAIAAETDRIYLNTASAVDIHDPVTRRRIHITKTNSRTTVVWNPWIERARALGDLQNDDWTRLVCVETCNVRPLALTLEPGQPYVMSMTIESTLE